MEVTVKLHDILIKDKETDEEYVVYTLRSASDIYKTIQEIEQDGIVSDLQERVTEAYQALNDSGATRPH